MPSPESPVPGADVAARVARLTKVYSALARKPVRALDGVDLAVPRGQVFGLLGPNGAGKTTLVKILLGICRRTGGEAELLGVPAPDASVRRRVGYLPEGHRFPGYLTGLGALDFLGALAGVPRAERRRRAAALVEEVGLGADAAARKVRGYSKGMLQRLGLAQALIADPDLLILDEPTDGVDPVGRRDIRLLLERLRAAGKTVIVNSHILSEIELVCDRVAVLSGGRLVHEGTVGELTRARDEWEVEVAQASDALAAAIAEHATLVVPRERGYLVKVRDEAALDRVVDAIRAKGAGLRGLAPHKASLEERVVELLKRETGAPAAPGPERAPA
jgi:ABC-2 type transport system ATP-binding protein